MGFIVSGIVIDKLPDISDFNRNLLDFPKNQVKSTISLCPKKLTIGFKNSSTYIFLDNLYYKNMSEEEALSPLESNIHYIFPNAGFLTIMINETSDIYGYSFVNKGKKIRTKCVMQGRQFLDFGELNPLEQRLQREILEYLKDKPDTKAKIDEHTKSMTELDAAKFHLIYRDKLYNRNKLANSFEYLGGSLDNYVIGKMFKNIVNCDFDQVENTRAIEFDRSKIDFRKESLGPFIFWAFEELQKG